MLEGSTFFHLNHYCSKFFVSHFNHLLNFSLFISFLLCKNDCWSFNLDVLLFLFRRSGLVRFVSIWYAFGIVCVQCPCSLCSVFFQYHSFKWWSMFGQICKKIAHCKSFRKLNKPKQKNGFQIKLNTQFL